MISIDTVIAHLAGAMGKAAWTLLPLFPDFRWLPGCRPDTPWYPKMRLIRQNTLGDWTSVIDRVRKGLQSALKKRAKS